MTDDREPGGGDQPSDGAGAGAGPSDEPAVDAGTDSTVDDAGMAAERERARALLEREDLDGVYAAAVSDDEYEYVLAHRGGDPEDVGMQAMGLLAQHVAAMVEQTDQPPSQVAGDAAMLARTLGLTGGESLADIEAELDRDVDGGDGPGGTGADADAPDDEAP